MLVLDRAFAPGKREAIKIRVSGPPQRSASFVLRLRSSANGHQGAEPSTDISPPFLSILQSGHPMLQGLCKSQRSASLVLRLRSSANGHQGAEPSAAPFFHVTASLQEILKGSMHQHLPKPVSLSNYVTIIISPLKKWTFTRQSITNKSLLNYIEILVELEQHGIPN